MEIFLLAIIVALVSAGLITSAAGKKLKAIYPRWGWLIALLIFLTCFVIFFFVSVWILDKFIKFER